MPSSFRKIMKQALPSGLRRDGASVSTSAPALVSNSANLPSAAHLPQAGKGKLSSWLDKLSHPDNASTFSKTSANAKKIKTVKISETKLSLANMARIVEEATDRYLDWDTSLDRKTRLQAGDISEDHYLVAAMMQSVLKHHSKSDPTIVLSDDDAADLFKRTL